MHKQIQINTPGWLWFTVYAMIIFLIYHNTFYRMIILGWSQDDYSYCYLIPFIIVYVIWEKRAVLATEPSLPSWWGLALFMTGIVLFWVGELGGEYYSLYVSLWLVIVGIAWLQLGTQKLKVIFFPLLMMFAMFPLPSFISGQISLHLKLISSKIGVLILHFVGIPAFREGNIIDLGLTQLQVVDACSGLRYMIPLMILSLLMAYWFKGGLWKKLTLFISSIPIAILSNSLRIALTGILYNIFGARVAEDFFHGFSGWLIFIFTVLILFTELWVLTRIDGKAVTEHSISASPSPLENRPSTLIPASDKRFIGQKALFQPQFLTTTALLSLTLVLSQGIEFREKIPLRQPLNRFPLQIENWQGQSDILEPQFVEALHFTDYVTINYTDPKGRYVNFYTAYYESQRKGESIHSPETCLPASGWNFREAGITFVTLPSGGSIKVSRAFIEKENLRQLAFFWFDQRGRILTNLYQLKIYAFWDSLTRQRTDGALIRIMTPVYPDEKPADAEHRLQKFTAAIEPVVKEFIPQ